jgi:predicted metal-dependent hydrolase
MKTKWGSCNRKTRHIWFNVELAKKHPDCLEYIVVHEMTHYLERNHGDRFARLMDEYMTDWRNRRAQLNDTPLVEEMWA